MSATRTSGARTSESPTGAVTTGDAIVSGQPRASRDRRGLGRRVRSRPLLSIALAVLAPLVVLVAQAWFVHPPGGDDTALPAIAAVITAAWFGGLLAGLVATAVAAILEVVVFMPPVGTFTITSADDQFRLVMLVGTGVLASVLAWSRSRAEWRARATERAAEAVRDRAELAARRLNALQRLATDLSDAENVDQILEALLHRARIALRADACAVSAVDRQAGVLTLVASLVADGRAADMPASIPLDAPSPAAEAGRTGEAVFVEDGAGGALGEDAVADGLDAVASVPMRLPSGPGVLTFGWAHPHDLPPERRVFIAALARVGAAALDRHRMFEAEVAALGGAEAATGQLNVLADAGRTLGTTLDYEDLLVRLPSLGVPRLGELGVVDVLEDGAVRRLVFADDPELQSAARILQQHPLSPEVARRAWPELDAGRAASFPLTEEVIAERAQGPEHGTAVRGIGPAWALLLPLGTQGSLLGTLSVVRRGERAFDDVEVAVAEELGKRAARSLENARLHLQVRDLAELERRRAAELEAVLGAVEEGFLVADANGAIRSSNQAATRLLGGPVTTLEDLFDRLIDAAGRSPKALGSEPEELQLRDHPRGWVEMTSYRVQPTAAETGPSQVIVCRDVTAFRRGQGLREAFLGLLSHELRTPVTTIYAGAAVLARRRHELEEDTVEELLADVAAEADRLYRLVEDLMVLARFDEGLDLGSQPVLLQHLIPAAVTQESRRWPSVDFRCRADPDLPTVGGDETAIAQVVRNLLSNAAKYGGPQGVVEVSVRAVADGVSVAVRDEGPGLDPAEADRVFDPFYRSPSTAGLVGGAGIGLYVSRRLVDAMGGRITASACHEGGSEFTFVLPRYLPDAAA
jgi:signal transduction histidine kinase